MRTILTLTLFCCFALLQKAAAQVSPPDTTSAAPAARPDPRSDRFRAMRDRRPGFGRTSVPFSGEPARRARHNTLNFKLPKNLVQKVRDGEITATSDYFKPTAASTPDTLLLADSAYVKDYRYFAYNKGSRQMAHPTRTGLIIGGSILVVITGIVALVVAIGHAVHVTPHMY